MLIRALTVLSLTFGLANSGPALAGKPEDLQKAVADLYNPYIDVVDGTTGGLTSEQIAEFRKFKDCRKKVAAYQKKFAPDDVLAHFSFNLHPEFVKASDGRNTIKVSQLGWFCDQYDRTLAQSALELEVNSTVQLRQVIESKGFRDDQIRALTQDAIKWLATGKASCDLAFAEAQKVFGPDDPIQLGSNRVPFKDLVNPCALYDEARPIYEAAWDKKAAPLYELYRGAGIGGDRLELFVYYGSPSDGGWLARGCQDYVTDVTALKNAKVLFHWAEGSDFYTVRKFSFTGDKYKMTVQTFATETRAYAGCR